MKNKILLSLTMSLMLGWTGVSMAWPVGPGVSMFQGALEIHADPTCDKPPKITCPPPNPNTWVTIWLDPGLIVATGLDLAATMAQDERTIDAKKALNELESSLGGGCNGKGSDGTDTAFKGQDTVPLVPDPNIALALDDDSKPFDAVRAASEEFLFYTDQCQDDCVLERQNTWLLTAISMAAAAGDKLVAGTKDMQGEFEKLQNFFNQQTSPKAMWAGSSTITVHTHVQQNDINALYSRDLEMSALNGVRESVDTKLNQRGN